MDRTLSRRDVTVLERLAQQLGIALDKRADFEREKRLRNHFQKYVPADIVAQGLNQEFPLLGGEIRDIVAMFVDIRGFTALAAALPPVGTVEILNRFFSVLEPIVTEHGGTIDKYFGDGALITWGSAGIGGADQRQALKAAKALLEGVDQLNGEIICDGYSAIAIGIGIHKGTAIVGNIGSKNRMEFTCVGSTVNLAARLEGQCKLLNASIVVSDVFAETLVAENECGWIPVDEVNVRGVTGNMRVWIFQLASQKEVSLKSRGVL